MIVEIIEVTMLSREVNSVVAEVVNAAKVPGVGPSKNNIPFPPFYLFESSDPDTDDINKSTTKTIIKAKGMQAVTQLAEKSQFQKVVTMLNVNVTTVPI